MTKARRDDRRAFSCLIINAGHAPERQDKRRGLVMTGLDPMGADSSGDSRLRNTLAVMAGLDPAIQARHSLEKPRAFNKALFRDGRDKPGHDKAAALILARLCAF